MAAHRKIENAEEQKGLSIEFAPLYSKIEIPRLINLLRKYVLMTSYIFVYLSILVGAKE